MRKTECPNARFQGVKETQQITGLSKSALYEGAKNGTFPNVRCGSRILFNIQAVLDVLDEMSKSCK